MPRPTNYDSTVRQRVIDWLKCAMSATEAERKGIASEKTVRRSVKEVMHSTGLQKDQLLAYFWEELPEDSRVYLSMHPNTKRLVERIVAGETFIKQLPEPVQDTLARQKRGFEKKTAREAGRTYRIDRHDDKPFALCFLGDPHMDNPGTDTQRLMQDLQLIRQTPGAIGCCVGDFIDNWAGRLERLYKHSRVTEEEAWSLWDTMSRALSGICVTGNHDVMGGVKLPFRVPMEGIARMWDEGRLVEDDGRWEFITPSGSRTVVRMRHDFRGRSIYNAAHGPKRERWETGEDAHITVAGHIHDTGIIGPEFRAGDASRFVWSLRVGAYKEHDSYAREKGFHWRRPQVPAVVVVIDPRREDNDPGKLTPVVDLDQGLWLLKAMRYSSSLEEQ